jgi:hypothetical protein
MTPNKPGWYWFRRSPETGWRAVEVELVGDLRVWFTGDEHYTMLADVAGIWGPEIPEPKTMRCRHPRINHPPCANCIHREDHYRTESCDHCSAGCPTCKEVRDARA